MKIPFDEIREYAQILRSTNLQRDYQAFLSFFRQLRAHLEQEFPAFQFSGAIAENGMDYAYFAFTNASWKREGLKFVVAFVHRTFTLELWLSGANRETQARWHRQWQKTGAAYELSPDPNRFDYILREVVFTEEDFSVGDAAFAEIDARIRRFLDGVSRLAEPDRG